MVNSSPVSVAIVSDNTLAREGLRRILEGEEHTVVESHSSSEDLANVRDRQTNPAIVILDTGSGRDDCAEVEACKAAVPDAKMVVLTDDFHFEPMLEVFKAGADAYIVKRIDCEALIESLKLVHLGEKVMPSELADGFPSRWSGRSLPAVPDREIISELSEREIETLRYLILGSPNKVIAGNLDISEATVKVHVKAILRKLGVQNRTQAAIWAVNNGIELNQPEMNPANESNGAKIEAKAGAALQG